MGRSNAVWHHTDEQSANEQHGKKKCEYKKHDPGHTANLPRQSNVRNWAQAACSLSGANSGEADIRDG
jgi:hypothetical protein